MKRLFVLVPVVSMLALVASAIPASAQPDPVSVLQQFQDVDAIVFGHFHRPYIGWHNVVLLFSPGGVYQLTPERARAELARPQTLMRRAYLLNARRHVARTSTVGMLTIEDDTIKAEILPLADT